MKRTGRPPALVVAFVLAVAAFLGFALHAVWVVAHLEAMPGPVQGWMTPGYVVRAYHVPPEAMSRALALEPGSARGKTLEDIAVARGVPVDRLLAAVQALVPQ